jgi:hypothetical protein
MRTKANKDLVQAACLLDYLLDNDLELVRECSRRLNSDPPCRFNFDPGRIAAF